MVVAFEMPEALTGDVSIVSELDDGAAILRRVAKSFGPVRKLAVGARAWSDTTIKLLQVFDPLASRQCDADRSTRCAGSNRGKNWK